MFPQSLVSMPGQAGNLIAPYRDDTLCPLSPQAVAVAAAPVDPAFVRLLVRGRGLVTVLALNPSRRRPDAR